MNYESQTNPTCPYCDHQHQDWFGMGLVDGEWIEITCESCNKTFETQMDCPLPRFDSRT